MRFQKRKGKIFQIIKRKKAQLLLLHPDVFLHLQQKGFPGRRQRKRFQVNRTGQQKVQPLFDPVYIGLIFACALQAFANSLKEFKVFLFNYIG